MPVDYNQPTLTNRLQQVVVAIGSSGFMRLLDSSGNILSTVQLATPMGVAASGVLTFNGLPLIDPSAAGSGAAAAARVEDATGTFVITGLTVSASGVSDILLSPTNVIAAGQTIAITSATITGN